MPLIMCKCINILLLQLSFDICVYLYFDLFFMI